MGVFISANKFAPEMVPPVCASIIVLGSRGRSHQFKSTARTVCDLPMQQSKAVSWPWLDKIIEARPVAALDTNAKPAGNV